MSIAKIIVMNIGNPMIIANITAGIAMTTKSALKNAKSTKSIRNPVNAMID